MAATDRPTKEALRRFSLNTASLVADIFFAMTWKLKGQEHTPSPLELAKVLQKQLENACKAKRPFLPMAQQGRIRTEIHPDIGVAQVWLLVGDLQWSSPENKSQE